MDLLIFLIMTGVGLGVVMDAGSSADAMADVAATAESAAVADVAFAAEDQTPTGKFTTATEVKQIVELTKAQWIAVRPWEGQDLLYFTNLLPWRCGTHQISYAVNGGDWAVLETEPCYSDEATPNALKMDGGILPYVVFDPNSIETVDVRILFDDLSEVTESFNRADVQIN